MMVHVELCLSSLVFHVLPHVWGEEVLVDQASVGGVGGSGGDGVSLLL
jgi:hypothetical protein